MCNGVIEGIGPRYCPSIESKIVRFADKKRHQLFIEPEGEWTEEMYVQGMSTSMPIDVQYEFYVRFQVFRMYASCGLGMPSNTIA